MEKQMRGMLGATREGRPTVVLTVVGAMDLVVATTAVAAVTNFTDVPDDHLFATEIAWMDENDITHGSNNAATRVCPEDFVTRRQLEVLLYRFAYQVDLKGAAV